MTLLDLPQGQFYDVVTALRGPLDVLYQYLTDDAKEAEFLRWCVVRPQEDWIKYKP